MRNLIKKSLEYKSKVKNNKLEKNRFLMLFFSILFIFDYFLICYLSDKNPFDIFPSIPAIEDKKLLNIYLPDIDGQSILKETRMLSIPENVEGYTKVLIEEVLSGSDFENTSVVIPVNTFIRKIWFYKDNCIVDIVPSLLERNKNSIPGSEKLFKKALDMTITENIVTIKNIILIERGIPGRKLWVN